MARIKGALMTRKRRKATLKAAKGYWGAKSKHGLKKAGVDLNRKMLAEIAISDKEAFAALAAQAKAAL